MIERIKPIEFAKTATSRKWALCPNCKAKTVIYDDTANCNGVWIKCTRGCKTCEFELVVENGKQIFPKK